MKNKIIIVSLLLFSGFASAQQPHKCQPENIPASTPTERFVDNADGTVTDTLTDLVWKKCAEGLSGADCSEGEPLEENWAEALLHLAEVNKKGDSGYKDWRMANIRELSTIVEYQCVYPAVNSEVFPNTPSIQIWTSSPYHFYTHYSWHVDFGEGRATYDERIRDKGLRLVRDLGDKNAK